MTPNTREKADQLDDATVFVRIIQARTHKYTRRGEYRLSFNPNLPEPRDYSTCQGVCQKFYLLLSVRLCVLYGYENKQKLLPYTTLIRWLLQLGMSVSTARYRPGSLNIVQGHVRFVAEKVAVENLSLILPQFRPCQYHSTDVASSSSMCCSYQKEKGSKPGNLRKIKDLGRKYFTLQRFS
jgi:hypothetical protein